MRLQGTIVLSTLLCCFLATAVIEAMPPMQNTDRYQVVRAEKDFRINELDNPQWQTARAVLIDRYWSGETAPMSRHFIVRMLWTRRSLYMKCEATQQEPLVVSLTPKTESKAMGLWGRDVCELFIAPIRELPEKYFEFEVAPNGEWLDLAIDVTSGTRVTDWDFASGMLAAARVDEGSVTMAFKVDFKAFDKTPRPGEIWLGNFFRAVGRDPDRGYLAWRPTMTPKPDFHVPSKFGEIEFLR
ncbi:MAG TPA: carbohydrate-binding family 9-like protein [Pyrinomonadaceae bacterium]|nr:carbohydrate-binding family 9-like protein [Pyrinomonadaceae bacterium]HMP64286.1 carbohydrate-binding family 9-like protein [Pyrinomonadaceae bacterium]